MYFVRCAARLSEYLNPPEPLNCTKPPVSVSQIWPFVTEATLRMPLVWAGLSSLSLCGPQMRALGPVAFRTLGGLLLSSLEPITSAAMIVPFLHTLFMAL